MKITSEPIAIETKRKYPYHGLFPDGMVVLFYEEKTGVCVKISNDGSGVIGDYSSLWGESIVTPIPYKTTFEG